MPKSSSRFLTRPIGAVDVFCGAGGLSLGLKWSGVRIAAGIDLDPVCRHPYEHGVRAPFLGQDVATVSGETVAAYFNAGEIRLLAGCAPCQSFSRYNARLPAPAGKWNLLLEFLRLVRETVPELITMENVPGLAREPIWSEFIAALYAEGFRIAFGVLDAAGYGVAQHRKRLVLMGSRLGDIALPLGHMQHRTVRMEIAQLPALAAGSRDKSDRMHAARDLTSQNLQRVRASVPAGSWKKWPNELRAECHQGERGRTYGSVYGRMSWDEPAPTMTTQFYGFGNGRFGHPEQDRALSLREGALLQSFPADYEFAPEHARLSARAIGRLIGNAVPPRLGAAIGRAFLDHVGSAGCS